MKSSDCEEVRYTSLTDGRRGLVLQGEMMGDYTGLPVASGGDLNGDHLSDLLIGAPYASSGGNSQTGKAYIVFGNSTQGTWGNGTVELTQLMDGRRGFVLQGEATFDSLGFSLSTAGDINQDGINDILVGAPSANPNGIVFAGKTYVILGNSTSGVWGNGMLDINQLLNGYRGFVLQGGYGGDVSGYAVSFAGDINQDGISDILIGAPLANTPGLSQAGKAYVIFGNASSSAWGNGILNLNLLMDGRRGFVLQGESAGEKSGNSLSAVGDVNADGIVDFVVGARWANLPGLNAVGLAYVIFGNATQAAWGGGVIDLSAFMNGQRGFILNGVAAGDNGGYSVSAAGDFNGDAIADFIVSAPGAIGNGINAGKTTVIFGGSFPKITTNPLSLQQGEAVRLNASLLEFNDPVGDSFDGIFVVCSVQHGQFELLTQPVGQVIPQFTQSQLAQADVFFVHDGSIYIPSYEIRIQAVAQNFLLSSPVTSHAFHLIEQVLSPFPLQYLPITYGFILGGDATGDQGGYWVSGAGDINGDHLADILVGALYANPQGLYQAGITYVIFGSNHTNAWVNSSLELNSLMDGRKGFALQGEAAGDRFGRTLSPAGDMNGDGIDDVLLGADTASPNGLTGAGKTYVLFGNSSINAWSNGTLNISSLMNGQRGFVLQGGAAGDFSSRSLSSGGDINGDHIADILIGADEAAYNGLASAGKTYVIFGNASIHAWGMARFNLTDLMDGHRGFMLGGEKAGDSSGFAVSNAGDINGDGLDDILVGAWGASSFAGNAYVIFGNATQEAWGNGSVALSSLMDGHRGVVLMGEYSYSEFGYSLSRAGDVNGDELEDILVSAVNEGNTYIVFGNSNLTAWENGTINIGSLMDGHRGCVLQGESAGDSSGFSISGGRDVNGDQLSDILISAYGAAELAGKTYVLFGNSSQSYWANGSIYLGDLVESTQGFILGGEIAGDLSGYSISMIGDMNGDKIDDFLIGAPVATFNNQLLAGKTYVIWGSRNELQLALYLLNNQFHLQSGSSLTLTTQQLNVSFLNPALDVSNVNYAISDAQHGHFELLAFPGFAIDSFTQSAVNQNQVRFIQDGSPELPSFNLTVGDGNGLVIFETPGFIDFNAHPIFVNNSLFVNQGQAQVITTANIAVSDREMMADRLIITISNERNGHMEWVGSSGQAVSSFGMLDIINNTLAFVPDGTTAIPSFTLSVSDQVNIFSVPGEVGFNLLPTFVHNELQINQGLATRLTSSDLSATDLDNSDGGLIFMVSHVMYGQFQRLDSNGTVIDNNIAHFQQQEIVDETIQFLDDGSPQIPSYAVSVSDGHVVVIGNRPIITFNHAPILSLTTFIIDQGRSTLISPLELSATDVGTFQSDLIFIVTNVSHGHFDFVSNPAFPTTELLQLQVMTGNVQFTHDGSDFAPAFSISVSNGQITTTPQPAVIDFNRHPIVRPRDSLPSQTEIQNKYFEFPVNKSIFVDPDNDSLTFSAEQANQLSLSSGLTFDAQAMIFSGILRDLGSLNISIIAADPRGLTTAASFNLEAIAAAEEISVKTVYNTLITISSIAGVLLGYVWWRKRAADHRKNYDFANYLRQELNLQYYDFSRYEGETYKTKVMQFQLRLNSVHDDFYLKLDANQKKCFAKCVAEIVRQRPELLSDANCSSGMYNWFFLFGRGWVKKLDLTLFEQTIPEIAAAAVSAWQAETHPMARWVFSNEPSCKESLKQQVGACFSKEQCWQGWSNSMRLFCGKKPVADTERMMESKTPLSDMELRTLELPPAIVEEEGTSSSASLSSDLPRPSISAPAGYSPRLVGGSDQTAIERRVEGMENQMKTVNQRLDALETAPLLQSN